jgi:hypothetical protein
MLVSITIVGAVQLKYWHTLASACQWETHKACLRGSTLFLSGGAFERLLQSGNNDWFP